MRGRCGACPTAAAPGPACYRSGVTTSRDGYVDQQAPRPCARLASFFAEGVVRREMTTKPRPPPVWREHAPLTVDEYRKYLLVELVFAVGADLSAEPTPFHCEIGARFRVEA